MLRRDGGPPYLGVHGIEGGRQRCQGPVHDGFDLANRVVLRHQLIGRQGTEKLNLNKCITSHDILLIFGSLTMPPRTPLATPFMLSEGDRRERETIGPYLRILDAEFDLSSRSTQKALCAMAAHFLPSQSSAWVTRVW